MQSTCLVSVRVMTHSVNTSAPAEHCESTDLTACAGVEGSDALPHPASATQSERVMVVRAAQMVFSHWLFLFVWLAWWFQRRMAFLRFLPSTWRMHLCRQLGQMQP